MTSFVSEYDKSKKNHQSSTDCSWPTKVRESIVFILIESLYSTYKNLSLF